ncbi:unnamed protein product, partial [marine sediment metagenome]
MNSGAFELPCNPEIMRKIIRKIGFLLLGLAIAVPNVVLAVTSSDLTFDAATNFTVDGYTLVVSSGSVVTEIRVTSTSMAIDMMDGSSITLTSNDRKILDNTFGISTNCIDGYSTLTLSSTSTQTVTVTIGGTCAAP